MNGLKKFIYELLTLLFEKASVSIYQNSSRIRSESWNAHYYFNDIFISY